MKVRDEVCGMRFAMEDAATHVRFQGKTYHFCSERCRRMFQDHPDWYVPVTESAEDPGVG